MRDMTDCISVVYVGRQNKKNAMDRMGVVYDKKEKKMRHDELYRCRLCWKIKSKNVMDRMGVIYTKTKQET